ncbi:hypothetical protein HDU98_004741, partial [Podochytrium sp. JEL0797]
MIVSYFQLRTAPAGIEALVICNGIAPEDLNGMSGLKYCITNPDVYAPKSHNRIYHRDCITHEVKILRVNTRFQCKNFASAGRDLLCRSTKSGSDEVVAMKQDASSPLKWTEMTPTLQKIRYDSVVRELCKTRQALNRAHEIIDKLKADAITRDIAPDVVVELGMLFADLYKDGQGKEALGKMMETSFMRKSNLFSSKSDSTPGMKEEKLEELRESSETLVGLLYEQMEIFA